MERTEPATRSRVTRDEHARRLDVVRHDLIDLGRDPNAIAHRRAIEWGAKKSQIRRYIATVMALWRQGQEHHGAALDFERMRAVVMSGHAAAREQNDHAAARGYLQLYAQMSGWLKPREVHVTGQIAHVHVDGGKLADALRGASDEELAAIEAFSGRMLVATETEPR